VLPLHPEVVAMVREWIRSLETDELLFPRIERKKTWLVVKKDMERNWPATRTSARPSNTPTSGWRTGRMRWQGCHPLSYQQTVIVCTMSAIRAAC